MGDADLFSSTPRVDRFDVPIADGDHTSEAGTEDHSRESASMRMVSQEKLLSTPPRPTDGTQEEPKANSDERSVPSPSESNSTENRTLLLEKISEASNETDITAGVRSCTTADSKIAPIEDGTAKPL